MDKGFIKVLIIRFVIVRLVIKRVNGFWRFLFGLSRIVKMIIRFLGIVVIIKIMVIIIVVMDIFVGV